MRGSRAWPVLAALVPVLAGCPEEVPLTPPATTTLPDAGLPSGPPELDPVSTQVTRTAAARLVSADGDVAVLVPALAVRAPCTLSLARLRDDLAPSPRLGPGYVLHGDGCDLLTPARVEWSIRADAAAPSSELRVAAPDLAGDLVPLPEPQAGRDVVAARLDGPSVLVLVDRRTRAPGWAADLPRSAAGDALLARGQVEAARAAYHAAREAGPDPHAALGRAVTELLLRTSLPPLSDVLLRCGLPPGALLEALVGPTGVLAQAAADRAGTASLVLVDPAGPEAVVVDEVYGRWVAGGAAVAARGPGFSLVLSLPPQDLPLGEPLGRTTLGGGLVVDSSGDRFQWLEGAGGSVVLYQPVSGLGGTIHARLLDVELSGPPGYLTVSGEVSDVITAPPEVLASLGLPPREGPPYEPVTSRILAQCSPDVTTAWLGRVAAQLAADLQPVASDLAEAGGSPATAPLLWLPTGLTRLPRPLPLTARDARLMAAALGAFRASLAFAAAYRWVGEDPEGRPHPLSDWLHQGQLHRWAARGEIEAVPARVVDHQAFSAELAAQVFLPSGDAAAQATALEHARTLLSGALGDLRAALTATATADGLVRFAELERRGLLAPVRSLVEALLGSLPAYTSAVPLDAAPGMAVQLSRLFDTPLTHEALVLANGREPLVTAFDGAPQGRTPRARDAAVLLHDRGLTGALWSSFLDLPRGPVALPCACPGDTACGEGFLCQPDESGQCATAGSACASDNGCPVGDTCARAHRCRRARPPLLDWDGTAAAFTGAEAPGWSAGTWHLLQAGTGMDPARLVEGGGP
jgi:hypothetical protein